VGQYNDSENTSGGNDPIFDSIKERKDAGSPFEIIRNKNKFYPHDEEIKMNLNG
jgi:hypothetical protein